MKTIKIAFDVDGTLRCNCTETCIDANVDIVELFHILNKFKNVELYVWSGGGVAYAEQAAMRYGLDIASSRCISKIGAPHMDVAVDDQHEFNLADINLIVRNK